MLMDQKKDFWFFDSPQPLFPIFKDLHYTANEIFICSSFEYDLSRCYRVLLIKNLLFIIRIILYNGTLYFLGGGGRGVVPQTRIYFVTSKKEEKEFFSSHVRNFRMTNTYHFRT